MKFELATILILVSSSNGFAPYCNFGLSQAGTVLYSSAAQEFIRKQQDAANNAIEEEEEPKLFSDELYADMQNCLLTLEKRVQEGPGCLDHTSVDDFAKAAGRILQDMKNQATELDERIKPGERQARAEAAALEAAEVAEQEGKSPDEVEKIAKAAYDEATAAMMPKPSEADSESKELPESEEKPTMESKGVTDENNGDFEEFDGKYGVAKGTANTYTIPGMDEMTAEEYQKALEQAVIDRAAKRRHTLDGRHGNQQTNDYMASLSRGRDTNPFQTAKGKKDESESEQPVQTQLYPQQIPQNKGGESKNKGVIDTPDDDDYYAAEMKRREAQAKKVEQADEDTQ